MEDSLAKLITSQRGNGPSNNAPEGSAGLGPDDLTNLNWVAGIPVPMNASVSPPDSCRKRLLYASPSAKNPNPLETSSPGTPNFNVPARTKSLKTPLPTYKIVLKDQGSDAVNHACSANSLSPERRDSVILANIVSSGHDYNTNLEIEPEKCGFEEEDTMVVIEKEGGSIMEEASTEDVEGLQLHHNKPNCSYTCLIGMALKASNGCLPVNAIYQYIEREFPYFITAPDGWKNSVRHNLSLNPIFRKVNREGWTGKKGYLWEVCPDKQDLVDKEILRFLHVTGKKLGEFTAPLKVPKYKQRHKKTNRSPPQHPTPIFCSRCTRIVSPTPPQESSTSSDDSCTQITITEEIKKYSTEIQKEIAASDLQLKPKVTATQSALDTTKSPSKYIGIKSPTTDPQEVAKEVFNLCPNPDGPPNSFYPINYGGPFIPFYTQPGQFGMPPYESLDTATGNAAGSSNVSPVAPVNPPLMTHYPQYALPMPFHYIQYPPVYPPCHAGVCGSKSHEEATTTQQAMQDASPVSVKVLSSSNQIRNVGSSHAFESVPLPGISSSSRDRGHKMGGGAAAARRNSKRQSSRDFLWTQPGNVAGLTSPLKRMKVMDDSLQHHADRSTDDSVSAYFADVSANSTCSDEDDANENEEVSSIMSLLLKSSNQNQQKQQQQQEEEETFLPLTQISPKQRESLEQIAGTSDLGTLLSNGLDSYNSKLSPKKASDSDDTAHPTSAELRAADKLASSSSSGVPAMDMPDDMDAAKAVSAQMDSYYLPSLDTLLNLGEDTIITLKAAMNLDIQGVVEVATEESGRELESASNPALSALGVEGIQIN